MTIIKALTTSDAAFMIQYALGPERDWTQTLEDMRGGQTEYLSMSLKPFGKMKIKRAIRPLYRMNEVNNFIQHAWLKSGITLPIPALPVDKIALHLIEDDLKNTAHWKVRRLTPHVDIYRSKL